MTNFALLPIAERSLLAGALFLASVSLLALLLYGILSRAKAWKLAFNGVFFVALTGFNAYVMAVAVQPDELSLSFPWLWLLVIATPLFLYSVCAIAVEHTKRKNVLSPSSVKETLDNLDSGICFGDGNGRIILVNRAMATLSSVLIGNTIRLNVYDKRFTVHTMKLVGATKGFIRKPFLIKAAFMGLFAAILAIIMLVALLFLLKRELPQLFELFTPGMLLVVMGVVIAAGLLICVVSTYFLVGKMVSLDKSELYY